MTVRKKTAAADPSKKAKGNVIAVQADPDEIVPAAGAQSASVPGEPTPSSPAEPRALEITLPSVEEPLANSFTLRLPPVALDKLREHTLESQWTIPRLVEQLVYDSLHHAFAAITYRGVELARSGFYRGFDRVSQKPALVLKSDRGEFLIRARPENSEFKKWLAAYEKRGERLASEKASEMCSFSLQQELEQFHGPNFTHVIFPEDFLVEQLV